MDFTKTLFACTNKCDHENPIGSKFEPMRWWLCTSRVLLADKHHEITHVSCERLEVGVEGEETGNKLLQQLPDGVKKKERERDGETEGEKREGEKRERLQNAWR